MNKLKMILDFILVLASCFFRSKNQPSNNPDIPPIPDPPVAADEREGNNPRSTGHASYPESATSTESAESIESAESTKFTESAESAESAGSPAIAARQSPADSGGINGVTLLGWCLIVVAGTSYLYRLLG